MIIEYYSPLSWRSKLYELINRPSKKFEVVFVTPIKLDRGRVTELMVGYWFVPR